MLYSESLESIQITREYECAKEISKRLIKMGEKEISLTKVLILLYLLYKEDKLRDNCFKFDSVFYKNIYGIPCNENVVLNFEADEIYKGDIQIHIYWSNDEKKLLDELILCYGNFTSVELYSMMQYDVFVSSTEINQNIIVSKELLIKPQKTNFIKSLFLGKIKSKKNKSC